MNLISKLAIVAASLCAAVAPAQPCVTWTQDQAIAHPNPEQGPHRVAMASDPLRIRLLMVDAGTVGGTVNRPRVFQYDSVGPVLWNELTTPGSIGPPAGLAYFGWCWDEANDRGVLFGGLAPNATNELWFWPGDDSGWVQAPFDPTWPVASPYAKLVYDPAHERSILLIPSPVITGNLETWELVNNTWVRGPDLPNGDSVGYNAVFDEHNGRVFLRTKSETAQWVAVAVYTPVETPGAGTWQWIPQSPLTQADSYASLAYDRARHQVIQMCGTTGFVSFDWSGSVWDDATGGWTFPNGVGAWALPFSTDTARAGAAMGYDPGTDEVILYGGFRRYFDEENIATVVNYSDTFSLRQRVPGFVQEPNSFTACAGQPQTLSCVAIGGPPVEYQWFKNNNPILAGTTPVLNLGNADPFTTPGDYHVVVRNDCGETRSRTATVTVVEPITITLQPQDFVACPGVSAIIPGPSVNLGATPVEWRWEKQLPGGGWQPVGTTSDFYLRFESGGRTEDGGVYRCRVSNSCGQVFSNTIQVFFGARFDTQPVSAQISNPCGSALLTASATTTTGAPPVYQWLLDGLPLVNGPNISGAQSATLTVSNVGPEDAGAFVCRVDDPSCGYAYSKPARLSTSFQAPAGWTQRATGGPPTRVSTAIAYDAARGVVVLYAGQGDAGPLADMWEWDGSGWTQRFPTTTPLGRTDHAMFYDWLRGRVFLFGGQAHGTPPVGQPPTPGWHTDLWRLEPNGEWTQVAPDGPPVYALSHETTVYHDDERDVYVMSRAYPFGGSFAESYEYDTRTASWVSSSVSPGIFIGVNGDIAYDRFLKRGVCHIAWPLDANGHTHVYQPLQTGDYAWQELEAIPPKNAYPELAFDPVRRAIVSFGADTFSNFTTPTFLFSGVTWAQLYASGPPQSPPQGFAPDGFRAIGLAFDTQRATMVLIGRHEFVPNAPLEVWEYSYNTCDAVAPCPADLAAPEGVLNFFDIQAFIGLFNTQNAAADLAAPLGVWNFFDIQQYIALFNAGCP